MSIKESIDAYRSTDFSIPLSARINAYLHSIVATSDYTGFDKRLLSHVTLLDADTDSKQTTFAFIVQEFMCNKDGNLHGGAISAIFDNLSSTSLFTIGKPGYWDSLGTSRSLSVVFHRALPKGMSVQVRCTVVAAGKRLATVRATMEDADGTVHASCVHDKVARLISSL